MTQPRNCVDIVNPFLDLLDKEGITNVQIIGGVGSAALCHPDLEIYPEARTIFVPDLYLPQFREDDNRRDLDVLVLSTDKEAVAAVEALAKQSVGNELELSVFGLKTLTQLRRRRQLFPVGLASMALSDRYVEQSPNGDITVAVKALLLVEAEIPKEGFETWEMIIGKTGRTYPIPHPGITILNYLTRSISGLRPKDAKKLHTMTANIVDQWPELLTWITEEEGKPQFELARMLHTLREPDIGARAIQLGNVLEIAPYTASELAEKPTFAFSGPDRLTDALLRAEQLKSRSMFFVEKRPRSVTMWQKDIEPHIQAFLKNN